MKLYRVFVISSPAVESKQVNRGAVFTVDARTAAM